ncbi:MAG: hypothetical protein VB066_02920 [Paludibacter sp.]|nr:hypothetical protein [Paludibacter sp.]
MSNPKSKYSIIVFFEREKPKKWENIEKLNGMAIHLNKKHPTWLYFNVYDRRTELYLKRFKKNDYVPAYL